MPKYIFHIGPHKTGTTYLQAVFKEMRESLQERGIHYPINWSFSNEDSSHKRLYDALLEKSFVIQKEFNELNNSKHSIVLISSEDLADLPQDSVKFLRHIIGDSPYKVVFYCRNWCDLIQSSWREEVKSGNPESLLEVVCSHLLNMENHHAMNFLIRLDRFSKFFKKSDISIVSYDNVMESGVNLVSHFCDVFLDWPNVPPPAIGRLNVSLPLHDIEVIRALHAIHVGRQKKRERHITDLYLEKASSSDAKSLKMQINEFLSYVEINETMEPFKGVAAQILSQYGACIVPPVGAVGHELFHLTQHRVPYISQSYLSVREISDGLFDFYGKIQSL